MPNTHMQKKKVNPLDKDIADFALQHALSKKVDYAEIRAHSNNYEGLSMKNGVLDAYVSDIDDGFCVRVLSDGGIGFASTNKWTKEEARNIVDIACKFAKMAKRKDKIAFAKEKSAKVNWKVEEKKKIADVPSETRIETLMAIDKELTPKILNIAARVFSFGTNLAE